MSNNQHPGQSFWSGRQIGGISIAISIGELLVFAIAIAMGQQTSNPAPGQPPTTIIRLIAGAWLFGGLASFVFALTGIAFDSRKATAITALIVSTVVSLSCATQMLV